MNLEKSEVNVMVFELVFVVVPNEEKLMPLLGSCGLVVGKNTTTIFFSCLFRVFQNFLLFCTQRVCSTFSICLGSLSLFNFQ